MNLTDFYFLCSFVIVLVIYYLVPKRCQWGVILVSSIAYYLLYGHWVLVLYPVGSVLVAYICTRLLDSDREMAPAGSSDGSSLKRIRFRKLILAIGIVILLSILLLLKYMKFMWGDVSSQPDSSGGITGMLLLVPLGLSYYTFTLIGYIVDVYNGIAIPERNFFRLLTFGMYAPVLVSGPIMQYREIGRNFYEPHLFDPDAIARGTQRVLWGLFKKLVIAERLGVIVASVYNDPITYSGRYVWLGILCFTFQLYSDFSGLMDMVLGLSQCFGLHLPENFNTPFFSQTVAEYWRRWHITLGVWFKEYVFFPLLRTGLYTAVQTKLKVLFSRRGDEKKAKKKAKRLSTYMAMFVLWLTVGLWHGGNLTFVIGSGLLHWFYIVTEEILEDPFKKLWQRKGIDVNNKVLVAVRIVRTFILVNIGNAFFRAASVGEAFTLIGCGFRKNEARISLIGDLVSGYTEQGIRILNDMSVLGLSYADIIIVIVSLIILLIVDILKTKYDVREAIAAQPVVLRFIIWFALLFYVILLGCYGPGYNAADFIYQGF